MKWESVITCNYESTESYKKLVEVMDEFEKKYVTTNGRSSLEYEFINDSDKGNIINIIKPDDYYLSLFNLISNQEFIHQYCVDKNDEDGNLIIMKFNVDNSKICEKFNIEHEYGEQIHHIPMNYRLMDELIKNKMEWNV